MIKPFCFGFAIATFLTYALSYVPMSKHITEVESVNAELSDYISIDYKTLARNYKIQFDSTQYYKGLTRKCI